MNDIFLVFQAAISFVLASMCSSNLLSGEVKLKVGNSDSDCRICFQPTLPNYCKEKHPENSKPFFFSVDLTQGANFTVSAVGKAKGLLPNQICRLCYDCVTVFANKTCIFAKSKSADCCYIPLGASAAKFGQNNESGWRLASAKYI